MDLKDLLVLAEVRRQVSLTGGTPDAPGLIAAVEEPGGMGNLDRPAVRTVAPAVNVIGAVMSHPAVTRTPTWTVRQALGVGILAMVSILTFVTARDAATVMSGLGSDPQAAGPDRVFYLTLIVGLMGLGLGAMYASRAPDRTLSGIAPTVAGDPTVS